MSKNEPSKAQILLTQANSYTGLVWIGLIFSPIFSIILCHICHSKITEAKLYKLTPSEKRQAEVIHSRTNHFIRFHWLDDEEPKSYFELKIVYNELTEDLMLEVTDFAEATEIDDIKDLWDSDIEKLRRVSGL